MNDDMPPEATPFLGSNETYESIGLQVEQATFGGVGLTWWLALLASLGLIGVLVISVGWLLYEGVGIWGNNIPVTWALDIVGYDWWIGLATGSLGISVILLLLNQGWRSSISRISETVAVLAAVAAAIYPIIHLGRPWFFYWNLPYPNTLLLWPQFRSPLYWDAVDI
ncbi:MAG: NrfD/PsrC family molybdoenzyme membrane anchor subunit, partial [Janthinobacterium lividum]